MSEYNPVLAKQNFENNLSQFTAIWGENPRTVICNNITMRKFNWERNVPPELTLTLRLDTSYPTNLITFEA